MGGYEIGLSGSAASSNKLTAQFGAGDTTITTGGAKTSQTLYLVIGAVVVLVLILKVWRR